MICILEAVCQSKKGKAVLMLDNSEGMGGAWRPLDIFGLHDVENAIHYFLPDDKAFRFMRENLHWDLVNSTYKFRVFNLPLLGYFKMAYDGNFSRLLGKIIAREYIEPNKSKFLSLCKLFKNIVLEKRVPSCYARGGTPEMLKKVKVILDNSNVEIKYSSEINSINIINQLVQVGVGGLTYQSKSIMVTHGSKISNLLVGSKGPVEVNDKFHRRPAVHLLVRDSVISNIKECIFTADPLIKYVHDVTHTTKEAVAISGKKKVFVLALQHEIYETEEVFKSIFKKLQAVKMISQGAELEDHYWTNVHLPTLYDDDLINLKNEFSPQIKYLKTENFTAGIGYNVDRWSESITYPK